MADQETELLRLRAKAKFKLRQQQASEPPPEPPAPEDRRLTVAAAAFPGANREYAPQRVMMPYGNAGYPQEGGRLPEYAFRTQGQGEQRAMAGAMDALSLPARGAGTLAELVGYQGATGGKQGLEALADPETGLMRPARQSMAELMASGMRGGDDGERGILDYGKIGLGGLGYLGSAVVEDPFAIVGAGAKPIAAAARLGARGGRATARGLDSFVGRIAEEMSGVSEDALRAASTKPGRAALQAASGKQHEIGKKLISLIENADQAIPEAKKVESALSEMGEISLKTATDALEAAKVKPVAGRLFPNEIAANAKIDTYINALRGGAEPDDLGRIASEAAARQQSAGTAAALKESDAKKAARLAHQASKAQARTQSQAAQTAGRAGRTKKEFLAAADQADANVTRYGGARNEAGQAAESALEEAQTAAAKARQVATDARAKLALGKITQEDADIAQAAAEAADRSATIAGTAARLYKGETMEGVAKALAEEGRSADDVAAVLKAARSKVEALPKLPDPMVSAPEYRNLRKRLDVNIDFDTEEGALVNNALKAGRKSMKDALIQKAEASGNPKYAEWMKSWSGKLDKIDEVIDLAGSTEKVRRRRIESVVSNLFGKNSEYKQQLIKDLDGIFGSNILGEAKTAALAAEIGKDGKAAWLPRQFTGRSVLGLTLAPGVSLPFASPAVASRILGMTRKLATARSAQEASFYTQALKRAGLTAAQIEAAVAASEVAQLPANAIPFRKVADGDTQQPQPLAQRSP